MRFCINSGKFKQLIHYGPIGAIFLILWITVNAFHCLIKWFPPTFQDPLSVVNFLVSWLWPVLIFYNYFRATLLGPGFVPKGWCPVNQSDEKYLQYCNICEHLKPPRAHHCKTCDRCIMKLDHHCPWINNCIGHCNHANFCWFLFYAICGCSHALLTLGPCIYQALFVPYYPYARIRNEPVIYFTLISLIASLLSFGFAIGVIIAVGFLFIVQLRNVMRNQTTIETWILRKASARNHRRVESFVYPYDLGWKENLRQIFNWSDRLKLVGDGLTWPVRLGCDQYTLTREQLEQKFEKRQRTIRYQVIKSYDGSRCPLTYGIYTLLSIPCSNESRISITEEDSVFVSRWENYWLYGDRKNSKGLRGHRRGWFPRACVREGFEIEDLWLTAPSYKTK